DRELPKGDLPFPVDPQRWRFRQSIEYSMTADRAVLVFASRYRATLLYNSYRMGKNSIERGGADHWTIHPQLIDLVKQAGARDSAAGDSAAARRRPGGSVPPRYFALLRDPARRDPRGYVIPRDQPDFPTATKFVNTLIENGVTVLRATQDFTVGGK